MHGSRGGARSGFSCAIGHTLVEFPLVLALALGLLAAASQPTIKGVIGLAGGLGLIGFGVLQIYETLKSKAEPGEKNRAQHSCELGCAWISINGSESVLHSLVVNDRFGAHCPSSCLRRHNRGPNHVRSPRMDGLRIPDILSILRKKGKSIVGSKYYKAVLIAFGLILIYYGLSFVTDAIKA